MNIYLSHSNGFDFKKELYKPIKESLLNNKYSFIFPHEKSKKLFLTKEFLKNNCDLLIAEVSYKSTGSGIEIGWADYFNIPIICIYKKGSIISNSLQCITDIFIEYKNKKDLIEKLNQEIKKIIK